MWLALLMGCSTEQRVSAPMPAQVRVALATEATLAPIDSETLLWLDAAILALADLARPDLRAHWDSVTWLEGQALALRGQDTLNVTCEHGGRVTMAIADGVVGKVMKLDYQQCMVQGQMVDGEIALVSRDMGFVGQRPYPQAFTTQYRDLLVSTGEKVVGLDGEFSFDSWRALTPDVQNQTLQAHRAAGQYRIHMSRLETASDSHILIDDLRMQCGLDLDAGHARTFVDNCAIESGRIQHLGKGHLQIQHTGQLGRQPLPRPGQLRLQGHGGHLYVWREKKPNARAEHFLSLVTSTSVEDYVLEGDGFQALLETPVDH